MYPSPSPPRVESVRRIGARSRDFLAPPAASAITVCAALRPTRLLPRLVTANGVSQSRSALLDPPPAASLDPSNPVCLASHPEQCWNHTKYADLANFIPDDVDHLQQAIEASITEQKEDQGLLKSFFAFTKLRL